MMTLITERYADKILGVLSCCDRVVITGMLVDIGYAGAMAATLSERGFRLFDYTRFTEPLRDEIRANAERLAATEDSHTRFNLLYGEDPALFQAIVRGAFAISGLRNRDLQVRLNKTPGQVSRLLKCLRLHGLIKKIGRTYKYYLTRLGQAVAHVCQLRS